MPDQQLPCATGLDDGGRAIARFLGRQGTPHLFARVFVQSDRDTPLPSHQADQPVAIDERMTGKTPDGRFAVVGFGQLLGPDFRTVGHSQAQQFAFRTQRVDSIFVNRWRYARAVGIGDAIGAGVLVFPLDFTSVGGQAQHAFLARQAGRGDPLWDRGSRP